MNVQNNNVYTVPHNPFDTQYLTCGLQCQVTFVTMFIACLKQRVGWIWY